MRAENISFATGPRAAVFLIMHPKRKVKVRRKNQTRDITQGQIGKK
jgi:hypothetical protein